MSAKIILRQHAVIPRSLKMASFAVRASDASTAMGLKAVEAVAVTDDLSSAPVELVQRLLASKGLTLTLIPSVVAEAVKEDRTAPAVRSAEATDTASRALCTIFSKIVELSSSTHASANDSRPSLQASTDVTPEISLADLSRAVSKYRLSLAVVSTVSTLANCSRVSPPVPGLRQRSTDARFYDSLVTVAAPQDADGFRSRPDLHIGALLDRMYFTGAALRVRFPDGEECDAYTSEDVGAAVASLMHGVDRITTAKGLGLSLPMYDALATHPSGHRTKTLFAFIEKAGANVLAVQSDRAMGWATAEDVRPVQLRA
jgi:hypothetical protein